MAQIDTVHSQRCRLFLHDGTEILRQQLSFDVTEVSADISTDGIFMVDGRHRIVTAVQISTIDSHRTGVFGVWRCFLRL